MKNIIAFLSALFIITGCSLPKQFDTHYAVVQEKQKEGIIDQEGYVNIKPVYKKVFNLDGDNDYFNHPHFVNLHWIHDDKGTAYAIVQNIDGKYGIVDPKGNLKLKPIYDSVTYFFDGFARIEAGGKFGLINRDFEVVLKPTFDEVHEFVDDIAILKRNGKFGCINRDMELKIKPTYDRIYFQHEKFLRTELNGKWGFLNDECEVIAKPVYDYVYDFSNGNAKVLLDGKIGYMNGNGELITKTIYTKESASF